MIMQQGDLPHSLAGRRPVLLFGDCQGCSGTKFANENGVRWSISTSCDHRQTLWQVKRLGTAALTKILPKNKSEALEHPTLLVLGTSLIGLSIGRAVFADTCWARRMRVASPTVYCLHNNLRSLTCSS